MVVVVLVIVRVVCVRVVVVAVAAHDRLIFGFLAEVKRLRGKFATLAKARPGSLA